MIIMFKGIKSNQEGTFRLTVTVPVEVGDDIVEKSVVGAGKFTSPEQDKLAVKTIHGVFEFPTDSKNVTFQNHFPKVHTN
jgi:hypothetical protein